MEIRVGTAAVCTDQERMQIVKSVSNIIETTWGVAAHEAWFSFREVYSFLPDKEISVEIHVFPAGSAKMCRALCIGVAEALADQLGVDRSRIHVEVIRPGQERKYFAAKSE